MNEIIKEQMDNVIDQEQLNDLSAYTSNLTNGLTDYFTLEEILNATLNGQSIFASPELIDSIKQLFFYEIKGALVVGVEILAICIIIGLLNNLSTSFGTKEASQIGTLTCLMMIVGIVVVNFRDVYVMTQDAMKTITYTMELLLPVLIGILVAMGKITSGTIMSPFLLTIITFFEQVIKNVILPAVYFSCMFTLLNCLTEKNYVNLLAKYMRKAALYVTGILLTVLTGIISVQGLITQTSDSLILGTAKYSIDAFIPIVGGFTADTIELFLTCMGSIKSVVGMFGILMISCLVLIPIIKIIAIAVIYKLTAMVIDPISTKKISQGIGDVGAALVTLSAILFLASLLFILFISSMMKLGG